MAQGADIDKASKEAFKLIKPLPARVESAEAKRLKSIKTDIVRLLTNLLKERNRKSIKEIHTLIDELEKAMFH